VKIVVLRGGEEKTFSLTTQPLGELMGEDFEASEWGFTVKGITRQMMIDQQLDDDRGVMVTGVTPSAPAEQGQLQRGDIIRTIGNRDVEDLASFRQIYEETAAEKDEKLLLRVSRAGGIRYILLKPKAEPEGKGPDEGSTEPEEEGVDEE